MRSEAILYVPSDTPESMVAATMKIAGVPLIVRGLMTLNSCGIKNITLLIAETQREKIENFLARYRQDRLPQLNILSYGETYDVSPSLAEALKQASDQQTLLINANLLFDKDIVSMMKSYAVRGEEMLVCRQGVHQIPIIKITRSTLATLIQFTTERPRSIESCIRFLKEQTQPRIVQKPSSSYTFLIHHLRERILAEKFLAESIRLSTSGPVARYINKRISLPISIILSRLWISPNAITTFNIIIGLFSGVFAADGHRYWVILLGAVLFQTASIVDGCDGEVAKLTFRCSKFGQYIDSMSDNLSLGSFMTGLIAGYWRVTHSPVAFYVGAIMIVTTFITFFWMIKYLKQNTNSASLVTFDTEYLQKLENLPWWLGTFIKYGKYTLKKDVFSFMFLVFAVFGILYWWLFITAFGTTLAAITLTYLNLRAKFKTKPSDRIPVAKQGEQSLEFGS